jgi:hypothetical protein
MIWTFLHIASVTLVELVTLQFCYL